jgi:hypothetical protein
LAGAVGSGIEDSLAKRGYSYKNEKAAWLAKAALKDVGVANVNGMLAIMHTLSDRMLALGRACKAS